MTEQQQRNAASWSLPAWHGCMAHNHNHCPQCRSCSHFEQP